MNYKRRVQTIRGGTAQGRIMLGSQSLVCASQTEVARSWAMRATSVRGNYGGRNIKKTSTDFLKFQQHFKKYQQLFGLTGYGVYFVCEPLDGCYANITVDEENKVATVRLNAVCSSANKPFKDVVRSAKHEALHLLIYRLEHLAHSRFTRAEEIGQACEEIVFKLEGLIEK